jgi:tetratricopeptide (TPR) repeat protein
MTEEENAKLLARIEECDEAIRLNPEDAHAWNSRGAAKNDLRQHEEAIKDCDEAIRLEPKNATAWNNRSTTKANLGDFDGAIKDAEEAQRLDPDNAGVINNIVAIKAEREAKKAVEDRIGAIKDNDSEIAKNQEAAKCAKNLSQFAAIISMLLLFGSFFCYSKFVYEKFEDGDSSQKDVHALSVILATDCTSKKQCKPIKQCVPVKECVSPQRNPIENNPFALLPWITSILVITSPLVWLIRNMLRSARKNEILEAEYFRMRHISNEIKFYLNPNNKAEYDAFRLEHLRHMMVDSIPEKIAYLDKNKSDTSYSPALEKLFTKLLNRK